MEKPKIFISYSWDNDKHKNRVTKLAQSLRTDGIECIIDDFKNHLDEEIGWETWIDKNMQSAEYILVVCTENYKNCFDDNENYTGDGGVKWEAELLRVLLKKNKTQILTIIFDEEDRKHIPDRLHGNDYYCIAESIFNVHDEKSDYHKIYRKLTKQYKTTPTDIGEIIIFSPKKEKLLNELTQFANKELIKPQELIDISKDFLEEDINQREIDKKTTFKDIIDYLDNLIINNNHPLPCIIDYIFQEKNSNNQDIKKWLDENYKSSACKQIKLKTKKLLKQKQNTKLCEDRIILEFEQANNKYNKYDISIHYFRNGKFTATEEPVFTEVNIESDTFQKELVKKLYDSAKISDKHLDILLPKPILLTDIKQWKASKRARLTKKFVVNIHLRERAIIKDKKAYIALWEGKINQLQNYLHEALKPMNSEDNETGKDLEEVGLMYLYQPKCTDTFCDDMFYSLISIRCGDSEKFKTYKQWWTNNHEKTTLQKFKSIIDHDDNSYMTIMWNDPKIPLKGDGI